MFHIFHKEYIESLYHKKINITLWIINFKKTYIFFFFFNSLKLNFSKRILENVAPENHHLFQSNLYGPENIWSVHKPYTLWPGAWVKQVAVGMRYLLQKAGSSPAWKPLAWPQGEPMGCSSKILPVLWRGLGYATLNMPLQHKNYFELKAVEKKQIQGKLSVPQLQLPESRTRIPFEGALPQQTLQLGRG